MVSASRPVVWYGSASGMPCYEKGENHGKAVVFLLSQACETKYDVLTISSVPTPPSSQMRARLPKTGDMLADIHSRTAHLHGRDGTATPPPPPLIVNISAVRSPHSATASVNAGSILRRRAGPKAGQRDRQAGDAYAPGVAKGGKAGIFGWTPD